MNSSSTSSDAFPAYYAKPLVAGQLVQRYKRFFADVRLASGEVVTAHCANTGTMRTCGAPGDTVYLLHDPKPTRKLAYTWELTETEGGFIGVNTARPNHIVARGISLGLVPELTGYGTLKQEVKYGANSRIDILLSSLAADADARCYVEVKNTTLLAGEEVQFPDAVTERGLKHLAELTQVARDGDRAVMFYLVNRPEGRAFAPAAQIDPAYAAGLVAARDAGVEILAYRAEHSVSGTTLGARLPVRL